MEIPVTVCFLFCFLPLVMAQPVGTESNVITQAKDLLNRIKKEHPSFHRHAVDEYLWSEDLNIYDKNNDGAIGYTGKLC